MPRLEIGSDNTLRLLGLRRSSDLGFVEDATVEATLRDGAPEAGGGSSVAGQSWPLALAALDQSSRSVGGEATGRTAVKSARGFDLTVTVGTTNALSLPAGALLWVVHKESELWRLRLSAAGAPGEDVVLHLDPYLWDGGDAARPSKVKAGAGEPVELVGGVYEGNLGDGLALVSGTNYWAEVSVDATTEGLQKKFHLRAQAKHAVRK